MSKYSSVDLVIVGASVRAACESARRGGLNVAGIDLFNDIDLIEHCPARRIVEYPDDIPMLIEEFPSEIPWAYTGGIENYPDLVESISSNRHCLGCCADSLRLVRDPFWLQETLRDAGLPNLAVERVLSPTDSNVWLVKPIQSAAGHGIHEGTAHDPSTAPDGCFFQEYAAGKSISATYITDGDCTVLIGVTEQLVGLGSLGAKRFEYCGSIGPLNTDTKVVSEVTKIGRLVASNAGLRGLFGIDFVLDRDTALLIEVNPRFTASMELLDRFYKRGHFGLHQEVFTPTKGEWIEDLSDQSLKAPSAGNVVAKGIVFTTQPVEIRNALHKRSIEDAELCDLPHIGTRLRSGDPICTAIVDATSTDAAMRKLEETAERIRELVAN